MSKRAIILCGGKGTRLRPYTWVLPKPLMPLGNTPILELILKQLKSAGFTHITLAVNHQAEIMKAFFGDGSKWNLKIDYSFETKPLSTMGPLKLIPNLPDNFLVMNGDILTNVSFEELYNFHVDNKNIFTISAFTREHVNDYGVLETDASGKLIQFREKPVSRFNVSMGIYIASKAILDIIPADTFYGFDHLMLDLIKAGKPATVKEHSGYWLDIGRPDDYQIAIDNFEKDSTQFLK
jgi:NDP-sugar pyrophosphorylase family protein